MSYYWQAEIRKKQYVSGNAYTYIYIRKDFPFGKKVGKTGKEAERDAVNYANQFLYEADRVMLWRLSSAGNGNGYELTK